MRRSYGLSAVVFCLVVLVLGVAFAQTLSEGGRYLLRTSTTMPDGRIERGSLAVEPGKNGEEARVKTFVLEGDSFKQELIPISELAKWPSPIKGFQFGISTDNELILVKKDSAEGPTVGILQNAQGEHNLPSEGVAAWLAGEVTVIKATRTADGRIRIGEAQSTKPGATAPAKQPDDSDPPKQPVDSAPAGPEVSEKGGRQDEN